MARSQAEKTEYMRQWRAKNREHHRAYLKGHNCQRLYGLTVPEVNERLTAQGGKCAICADALNEYGTSHRDSPYSSCVDHDHESNRVRGILCRNCNLAIGYLRDSPEYCRQAADYLERR